jgi:hypothetical protein
MVYFLSLKFLDEDLSLFKVAGVMLALMGCCLIQITKQKTTGSAVITQADYDDDPLGQESVWRVFGSTVAIFAELFRISYHIWWKCRFGSPSLRFVILWYALVGMVHLCVIGPLIVLCEVVLDTAGCDAHCRWRRFFGLYIELCDPTNKLDNDSRTCDTLREAILIAVICMFGSLGGIGSLCVVSQHSPLLWSAVRLLTLPVGMGIDFFVEFKVPASFYFIGCGLIVASFMSVSGIFTFSSQSLEVTRTPTSPVSTRGSQESAASKQSTQSFDEKPVEKASTLGPRLRHPEPRETQDQIEMTAMSSDAQSDIVTL